MLTRKHYNRLPSMVCVLLNKQEKKWRDYLFLPVAWDEYADIILNWKGDILTMPMPTFLKNYEGWV